MNKPKNLSLTISAKLDGKLYKYELFMYDNSQESVYEQMAYKIHTTLDQLLYHKLYRNLGYGL